MRRIGLVCDISGKDDEGMKKVARNIATVISKMPGYEITTISTAQSMAQCKRFEVLHFIGGPTVRTILIAFLCRILNFKLKTILTFSNPFLRDKDLVLLKFFRPSLCLVSSQRWMSILKKINVPVVLVNVSGVNLNKFVVKHAPARKSEIREKLDLPPDKLIVLHAGHLKEDRNLLSLIPIQSDPDIQLVIIGSTSTDQSATVTSALRGAGIIVVTEYLPSIEEYFHAADCYVFPTINQRAAIQVPLGVLEALASGLPVVSTNFGGLKDTFGQFDGAIRYFNEREFGSLNEIIKHHCSARSSAGRYLDLISWESVAANVVKCYE